MTATPARAAPLSDKMLTMDVADTLRRTGDTAPAGADAAEGELIERLRALYRGQGLDISDAILREGIAAARDGRFAYAPPRRGAAVALARLYVARRRWLPATLVAVAAILLVVGGFFLVYQPLQRARLEQARLELATTLPDEMDSLYRTIFDETKVQQAANEAAAIRDTGHKAAAAGDRAGAEKAVAGLVSIRDTLRRQYELRIVDRPGEKWGFWTFPHNNTDATAYYLVVEAIDESGTALSLPVPDTDTGTTSTVSIWGLRVSGDVWHAVEADRSDDGTIEHNLVAIKDFGFLEPDYLVHVLGGTVTRW